MNARPANRLNHHSASTMAMSDGPGRCSALPAAARSSSFAQDFNHEHSGAARSVSAKPAVARDNLHRDSASPNCIYLG
jgi:hypothetical protein